MIGTVISHYRIVSKLGEGGMGVVYQGIDTLLLRPVAIKFLPQHLVAEKTVRLRFLQEARAVSALNHPNICIVHDLARAHDLNFMVMELVEGQTLRQALQARGALPEEEVIALALQVCDALAAAHARGIIHRDIKPDNIMVTDSGQVKIMDFGLARLKTEAYDQAIAPLALENAPSEQILRTSASSLLGTAAYMAPEQIERGRADERSDIFALGVVLYELLTAAAPFPGSDNISVMKATLARQPRPPSALNPQISPEMERIVLKALAKKPRRRYQRMEQIKLEFEKIRSAETIRLRKRKKRQGLLFSLALLTVLFLSVYWIIPGIIDKRQARPAITSLKLYPIGVTSEHEDWPNFSPDGAQVIYHSHTINAYFSSLMIRTLNSGKTEALPVDRDGEFLLSKYTPSWSPDGERIAFSSRRGIYVVSKSGGKPRRLTDFGYAPRWSPGGEQIAFCRNDVHRIWEENAIFLYDFRSQRARQVSPRNGLKFAHPEWSPDGKRIACLAGEGSRWEMWMIEAASGRAWQLGTHDGWIHYLRWSHSGEFIYFCSSRNGPADLWRVRVNPASGEWLSEPQQLSHGLNPGSFDLSPDDRRIAFGRGSGEESLWKVPLPRASANPWREARLLTNLIQSVENLEISPDGTWLVYEASPGGMRSLRLVSTADGAEKLLYNAQAPYAPCWSPDGQYIVFDAGGGNQADIWRVAVSDGRAEKVVEHPGADWLPTWSPGGEQLCFVSNRSGQFDLWMHDLTAGSAFPITHTAEKESRAAWSHDGRRIAFFRETGLENCRDVWVYDLDTRSEEKLLRLEDREFRILDKLAWGKDDRRLYTTHFDVFIEISPEKKTCRSILDQPVEQPLGIYAFAVYDNYAYLLLQKPTSDLWIGEGLLDE